GRANVDRSRLTQHRGARAAVAGALTSHADGAVSLVARRGVERRAAAVVLRDGAFPPRDEPVDSKLAAAAGGNFGAAGSAVRAPRPVGRRALSLSLSVL